MDDSYIDTIHQLEEIVEQLQKENEELKFKLMQVEEFCDDRIKLSITDNVIACCKLVKKIINQKEV